MKVELSKQDIETLINIMSQANFRLNDAEYVLSIRGKLQDAIQTKT